jgi:hypothetical protein
MIDEKYQKEYDQLAEIGNSYWTDLLETIQSINNIPPLTDLAICKKLEDAYSDIYRKASNMAEISLKTSLLYRKIRVSTILK